MELIRPQRLKKGDLVVAICDSWGGAGELPHRYEAGIRQIEEEFGLKVVPTTHAMRDATWLKKHPEARAADLMEAFANPDVKGIISVIGGEESIRILPYLDLDIIRANPKVFVGFSDTTVTHFALLAAGLVTSYGPSLLAGFAENAGMIPYLADSFRQVAMSGMPVGEVKPNTKGWTVQFLEWSDPSNQLIRRTLKEPMPWRWLQGDGVVSGRLMGGCLEVVDWLRGSRVWPTEKQWAGSVLILETSEEKPQPREVTRMLRSCAAAGMFAQTSALLMGRPCTEDLNEMDEQDAAVLAFVRDELHRPYLPVVTRVDFGHTSPALTLPLGVPATLDCTARTLHVGAATV